METKPDDGLSKGEEKEKRVTCEEEIELVSTDMDFEDIEEDDGSYYFAADSEKLLPFNGLPILLIHDRISCGAPSYWWLPLTEFEPSIVVHASISRSSYIFLGVATAQVYLRLKGEKDAESLVLAKQVSEIIGREFGMIWKENELPDSPDDKIELSLSLMELSIVCASVSWAVHNVDKIVTAASAALPNADWPSHVDDLGNVMYGLRESLERVVDLLCTEAFGQTCAKYRDEEKFH